MRGSVAMRTRQLIAAAMLLVASVYLQSVCDQDRLQPSSGWAAEARGSEDAAAQLVQAFRRFIKEMEDADFLEQPLHKRRELEVSYHAQLRASVDQTVGLQRTMSKEQAKDFQVRYFAGLTNTLEQHQTELRERIATERDPMNKGRLETWVRYWELYGSQLTAAQPELKGRPSPAPEQPTQTEMPEIKSLLHQLANPSGRFAIPPDGEVAQHIAVLQVRVGDLYGAFHTAIQSANRRIQIYIKIGEACAIIRDFKCVESALQKIENDELAGRISAMPPMGSLAQQGRTSAITVIAMAQIKHGDLTQAENTFSKLDLNSMHPELADQSQRGFLKELAMAHVRRHDAKAAIHTVERITKVSSQDHVLADVAIGLAEAGEPQGAKQAVELLRKHRPGTHFAPRIVKTLVKAGDREEAVRFLEPLVKSALQSHNEWALSDCAVAQAYLDPKAAVQTALKLPEKTGNAGYSHRDSTLASIAAIQAKRKDFGGSYETISLVQGRQTHDSTLIMMTEDLIKDHDLQPAFQMANAIKDPTSKHELAKVRVLIGDTPGAMRLATSLPNSFEKSQAFASIVTAQIAIDALEDAVQTAALIDHDNVKDRTNAELAVAHVKAGQLSPAIKLAKDVRLQRTEVMSQIGLIHASTGKWDEIWRLTQAQVKLPDKDSLLLGMMEGMLDYQAAHNGKKAMPGSKN